MTDFKAKMHQIRFRLGLRPRPRWGSLQRSPRPPSRISPTSLDLGAASRQGDGLGWERGGKGGGGRGGRGSGGEGKGGPPSYCRTRAPQSLATPLDGDTEKACQKPALQQNKPTDDSFTLQP